MRQSVILIAVLCIFIILGIIVFLFSDQSFKKKESTSSLIPSPLFSSPLEIATMRKQKYPGSEITIEQTLSDGRNYHQYIASYRSDGLKIYGLLTVPIGEKPKNGWPVIIFNHGYIPPNEYQTTERYVAYVDAFARNGYVVFKSDYRGNGNSEGIPEGSYYSSAYTIDVLNALASIKKYPGVNPNKIGMWGHSMGGNITLRSLVVDPNDIKAAVIWGGVVGSYTDIMHWHDPLYRPPTDQRRRNNQRESLMKKYGTPESNPAFWNSIDPTHFLADIKAPIQLDAGSDDIEVPAAFSAKLATQLQKLGKTVEFYEYSGSDHNISQSFDLAIQRSIEFFNRYLK